MGMLKLRLKVRKLASAPSVSPPAPLMASTPPSHRAQHEAEVAQLGVYGPDAVGVAVGVVGRIEQAVVESLEFLPAFFLVAEHLDHLLAVHVLLDIAVYGAQIFLLGHEMGAGPGGVGLGGEQHHAHHGQVSPVSGRLRRIML
jgi:hypothetical protein